MILVIGGAWQGKLTWAIKQWKIGPDGLCDLAQGYVPGKQCYYHLEALTRAGLPLPAFEKGAVVISREVGCGVVPMDPEERLWRERHGAALQQLSRQAEQVFRVFCGLAEVLK